MSTLKPYAAHFCVPYDLELQSTDGNRAPFGKLILGKGDHISSIFVFGTWTCY